MYKIVFKNGARLEICRDLFEQISSKLNCVKKIHKFKRETDNTHIIINLSEILYIN